MYSMKNVRISSDILDMVPCIRCTYTIVYLHALVSRGVLHTGVLGSDVLG